MGSFGTKFPEIWRAKVALKYRAIKDVYHSDQYNRRRKSVLLPQIFFNLQHWSVHRINTQKTSQATACRQQLARVFNLPPGIFEQKCRNAACISFSNQRKQMNSCLLKNDARSVRYYRHLSRNNELEHLRQHNSITGVGKKSNYVFDTFQTTLVRSTVSTMIGCT